VSKRPPEKHLKYAVTMRVILTRPEREARSWVTTLAQAGIQALALPLIAVDGAPDPQAVQRVWQQLDDFDAAMFVSGNAVDQFYALKPATAPVKYAQAAIKMRAFVTGPGTRSALLRHGVAAHLIDAPDAQAGQWDSEALWAVVQGQVRPGFRLLIVRGAGADHAQPHGAGRDWFAQQVQARGGQVEFVVAYQRRCPVFSPDQLAEAQNAAVDGSVWLFSSSEAIGNLQRLLPEQSWHQARAVATHPRIAQAAREAGFGVVCESRPQLPEVVASIESMA
jgi:uroporphyrinogen-III synthase